MALTAVAVAALNAGRIPISIFELDLPDGTTLRAAQAGASSKTKAIKPYVPERGFGAIAFAASDFTGRVESTETTVLVNDPEIGGRELTKKLRGETGRNLRGSAARILGAVEGLDEDDWWFQFKGIALDASYSGDLVWRFRLSLDLEDLRGDGHRTIVSTDLFPTRPDVSEGAAIPLVFGVQDSTGTGETGLIECVKISTDGDPNDSTKPHRYAVSEGRLPDVPTRWVDGASETALGNRTVDWFWTERKGVVLTEIGFAAGSQPADDAVVTVDAYGLANVATPTSDPANTSEVVTNHADALRLYLTNFVFNRWNGRGLADWIDVAEPATALLPFDDVSLSRARADLEKIGAKAARVLPLQSVEQTLMGWFGSTGVGYFLNEEGNLGLFLDDIATAKAAVYEGFVVQESDLLDSVPMEPSSDDVISRILFQHFLASASGEFRKSGEVSDPHRSFGRTETIEMPWSSAAESF